jgi:hypothetical protein
MVLAFLLMSVVLYILVRRSVEKRQARKETAAWAKEPRHSPSQSRTSVAASDSPEVSLPISVFLPGLEFQSTVEPIRLFFIL